VAVIAAAIHEMAPSANLASAANPVNLANPATPANPANRPDLPSAWKARARAEGLRG